MVDIDLVVVNYKTYDLLQNFIDSYEEFKPTVSSRLIVVDNESDPEKLKAVNTYTAVVVASSQNKGYADAFNTASCVSDSKYLAVFNSDTRFVNDSCVDTCVDYLDAHDDVAVVGPLQYSSQGKVTHGGIVGTLEKPTHRGWGSKEKRGLHDIREAVTVSGSAYFTKRSVWDELRHCDIFQSNFPGTPGAFPPFPHFYEETLYSYHAQGHGYKCVYLGTAEMIHEWHKSSPIGSQDEHFRTGQKLFRKFCDSHGIAHD